MGGDTGGWFERAEGGDVATSFGGLRWVSRFETCMCGYSVFIVCRMRQQRVRVVMA